MRITTIIPCYNAGTYLGEAIASVRRQSRSTDELIVVDDCSQDGSAERAAALGARVLTTSRNSGHAAARNLGVAAAQGELVAWLDADDFWETEHLATVVALLESFPQAAVAFSGVRRVGAQSGLWTGFPCTNRPRRILCESYRATIVPAMSAITRTAELRQIGGFDESIRVAPDFDLWLRMSRRFEFVSTDQVTANYRWHESQISSRPERQMASMWATRARFLQALHDDDDRAALGEIHDVATELWNARLWTLWERGSMRELRAHLRLARYFQTEPPLARAFSRRAWLPGPAVVAWQRWSRRSSLALAAGVPSRPTPSNPGSSSTRRR